METMFYRDSYVQVTNARFVTHNQTHALSGITSVTLLKEPPIKTGPVLMAVGGVIALLSGVLWLALIVWVLAFLWYRSQRTDWIIVLRTAAGEVKAVQDRDEKRVAAIVDALNQAIVARG